jgi:type VI secretion system protein VasD
LIDKSLEAVGLRRPEVVEDLRAMQPSQPRKLTLRIHAGDQLNTDSQKRSLSLVVKIYKLKSANAFLATPYKSFGSSEAERAAFAGDLLEVRELVFTPGQRHEVVETLPLEASHLAVVALFRAPSEGRWRFAFNTKSAEKTGVTLGLHGCAMSVAAGVPEGVPPEALRVAGVQCQ